MQMSWAGEAPPAVSRHATVCTGKSTSMPVPAARGIGDEAGGARRRGVDRVGSRGSSRTAGRAAWAAQACSEAGAKARSAAPRLNRLEHCFRPRQAHTHRHTHTAAHTHACTRPPSSARRSRGSSPCTSSSKVPSEASMAMGTRIQGSTGAALPARFRAPPPSAAGPAGAAAVAGAASSAPPVAPGAPSCCEVVESESWLPAAARSRSCGAAGGSGRAAAPPSAAFSAAGAPSS